MSGAAEIDVEHVDDDMPPLAVVDVETANGKPQPQRAAKEPAAPRLTRAERRAARDAASPNAPRSPFRELEHANHKAVAEIIQNLVPSGGAYRIEIKRQAPEEVEDPITRRMIKTKGHLCTLESEPITEDEIAKRWGGGKYELVFKVRGATGSYDYVRGGHAVIEVAGEPFLTGLQRITPAPQLAPAPSQGDPSLATKALDVLSTQLEAANQRADRSQYAPQSTGPDPSVTAVMEMMRQNNERMSVELGEMRRELMAARNTKPESDPIKDRFLDKLIDQDSARIDALRTRHESEVRMLQEHAINNERRLRDEADRDKKELQGRADLMLQLVKQQYDTQIAGMKQSHELALAALKQSFETQTAITAAENKRLERDFSELRVETKELRLKKDKSLIEQVKDIKTIKEALDIDGEAEPKGALATLAEAATNPEIWQMLPSLFGKKEEAAPPAQHPQLQTAEKVYRDPNGQFWKVSADGVMTPARKVKKKKVKRPQQQPDQAAQPVEGQAPPVEGAEAAPPAAQTQAQTQAQAVEPELEDYDEEDDEAPELSVEDRTRLVGILENAVGRQDPAVVAQMLRSHIPGPALAWLGDKCSELGVAKAVNMFLSQVAKVETTSPLMSQDGRNWVRQLARDLLGDSES